MENKFETTYLEPLTIEEVEMLHRYVCSGMFGGDAKVRSSLYNKVQKAKENSQLGRAWYCTRDILETQKATSGKSSKKEKERHERV